MELALITMSKVEARTKLSEYRKALHKRADAEWDAAAKGYEQLAIGRALFCLSDVIRNGGLDDDWRPRLAIGRADWREINFLWRGGSSVASFCKSSSRWSSRTVRGEVRDLPMGQVNERRSEDRAYRRDVDVFAPVPMVPAEVANSVRFDRTKTHILWEVEQWSEKSMLAPPPRDPYLVQHLGGDLWAILAQWDLTELERAVMAGRRPA